MTDTPRASIVVPAYNEGENILPSLDRIFESVKLDAEVLVVVDTEQDTTIPVVSAYASREPRLRYLINDYGRGPAQAIRYGIDASMGHELLDDRTELLSLSLGRRDALVDYEGTHQGTHQRYALVMRSSERPSFVVMAHTLVLTRFLT